MASVILACLDVAFHVVQMFIKLGCKKCKCCKKALQKVENVAQAVEDGEYQIEAPDASMLNDTVAKTKSSAIDATSNGMPLNTSAGIEKVKDAL